MIKPRTIIKLKTYYNASSYYMVPDSDELKGADYVINTVSSKKIFYGRPLNEKNIDIISTIFCEEEC